MRNIGHLPVVDPRKPNQLVGMLDRESILDRYKSDLSEEVKEETLQGRLLE